MKLISKGLLISILFVLLLVSVKADLDPVFYDNNLLNNYPYGNHQYLYESGDEGTASRGNQKMGSMWNDDTNAYAWDVNIVVAFCRGGGDDCPTNSGAYEAWVEFYGFLPATTNFQIYYDVDDFMYWFIDSTPIYYFNSNGYVYSTRIISPGWHYFKIYYVDMGGNKDHLYFKTTASSAVNAPYYKFFTALVSPDQYTNINQKIHLDEGSVDGDCKDFIDNDGDWNLDGDFSNDGVAAFDFDETIYGIDPPQGRGYKILNDKYPQFGELNVDCFDQGCEGQDGPYDWNGKLGKCNYQTEKRQYCNDGYDNDFDGLTDLDDPDCTSFCQGGDLNLDVISLLGNQYLLDAVDGSDGCCGDDSAVCYPTNSLPNFPPCNYNTQSSCDEQKHCKWESNACIMKTHSEYCEQFSQLTCPPGICQFHSGDYGYVTPDNQYLCYNNKSNFYGGTENKWMWIYAPEKPFIITPLNFSGKTVDYISNSEKWYYCDANPTPGLKGLPVAEYASFPAGQSRNFESMECSDIATILRGVTHYDCNVAPMEYPCCYDGEPKNIFQDPDSVRGCDCMVDSGNSNSFCTLYPEDPFCDGALGFGEEEILKELCKQNERLCSDLSTYDENKQCSEQDFGRGLPCPEGNVCVNGVLVYPKGERCCFGDPAQQQNKKCVLGASITNEDECLIAGGIPYDRTENLVCAPLDQDITIGENQGCCFGVFMNTLFFPFSFFENENNNTFSCFAQESNNYFGQCCVGYCNNLKNLETINIDNTQNRIFSLGTEYNLLNSYDRYVDDEISKIDDLAKRFTTKTPIRYSLANINYKDAKLSYYEYIEMDVVYNRKARVGKIYINDVPYDSLWSYSTNGDQDLVPHHIKIKLNAVSKSQILQSIKIDLNGSQNNMVEFKYDNVYLTIDPANQSAGSDNYYCTGGFNSWIPQLDSDITNPDDPFFNGENAWITGYGRFAATCEAQWPYVWTGHYCCGDDTDITQIGAYGEYYNDTPVLTWSKTAGCFAGIGIPNGETVWKKNGYLEDYTKFFSSLDELKLYTYSDLIYYDNKFIGCQVPLGKYDYFTISYDGNYLASNPKLVNNFTNDQCKMVGTYYCFNGVWRQYVPGLEQEYDIIKNAYYPIPSSLELKSVPPAAELIKNGDFGGECPPEICNYQQ